MRPCFLISWVLLGLASSGCGREETPRTGPVTESAPEARSDRDQPVMKAPRAIATH
jgi:hypothetical protein